MASAFLGLGSNLGDREANVAAAVDALSQLADTRLMRVSSWLENPAVDSPVSAGAFLNGVVKLETRLTPRELLAQALRIERELGRKREGEPRNSPRTIDIDLLLYADVVMATPDLVLPHPRMGQRHFVLWPLLQIEPRAKDPKSGELWADALARLNASSATNP